MLQPTEFRSDYQVEISNDKIVPAPMVWEMLTASYNGDIQKIKTLAESCAELLYAQYNYAPPIHFAVREGHTNLVKYFLENGAYDPSYQFYPFQESLITVANDRSFSEIEELLKRFQEHPTLQKFKGDNGRFIYNRSEIQMTFEQAVAQGKIDTVEEILKTHPAFASDNTYFWSEGILLFAVKEFNREMIDLLMSYGATVPSLLKWAQFYYFERLDAATYIMQKGMNPNTMSWQHVTLLHDMAQKGFIEKADLLISHGANIDAIDEAYQTTPLGLAARWGQIEMVKYLLSAGADPRISGKTWATPLAWAKKKGHEEIEELLLRAIAE